MRRPETGPAPRGRLKLLAIGAFFALPVLTAWIAWWLHLAPGATGNYGTLLSPQPVAAAPLAALRGRWVLVQFDGGACDSGCERKLYIMRQIRRAQGGEMGRVERLWFVTDGVQPRAELLAAIAGTEVVLGAAAQAAAFPPGEGSVKDHIFLVDPIGNLMMRFPRDPDPSRMIKDLQHLLKVSQFG